MVTAGCVGLEFSSSVPTTVSNGKQAQDDVFDTIAPRCAWWLYEFNRVEDARKDEEELFKQAYRIQHNRAYPGKFHDKAWTDVHIDTVLKILSMAGVDDQDETD